MTPYVAHLITAILVWVGFFAGIGIVIWGGRLLATKPPEGERVDILVREVSALDARSVTTSISPPFLRWLTGVILVVAGLMVVTSLQEAAIGSLPEAAAAKAAPDGPGTADATGEGASN
jgi:hypothetical protein